MKIIFEIYKRPSGRLAPCIFCLDDNNEINKDITSTLCDFIGEYPSSLLYEIGDFLDQLESAKNDPRIDPAAMGISVNDKYVTTSRRLLTSGHVIITNEYIPKYTVDEGHPPEFSIEQVRLVLNHWIRFLEIVEKEGIDKMVGEKYIENL
jgi:hypothetical protein